MVLTLIRITAVGMAYLSLNASLGRVLKVSFLSRPLAKEGNRD